MATGFGGSTASDFEAYISAPQLTCAMAAGNNSEWRALKRKIARDWGAVFPTLHTYTQQKYYVIVGPVVRGLEIMSHWMGGEYRIYRMLYPLWKESINSCLKCPILYRELVGGSGLQLTIPYKQHDMLFERSVEAVKTQVPIYFFDKGEESIYSLYESINEEAASCPQKQALNSFHQAAFLEAKIYMALYANEYHEIDQLLREIESRPWDLKHFEACSIDYDSWIGEILNVINNRNNMMVKINQNGDLLRAKKIGEVPFVLE